MYILRSISKFVGSHYTRQTRPQKVKILYRQIHSIFLNKFKYIEI